MMMLMGILSTSCNGLHACTANNKTLPTAFCRVSAYESPRALSHSLLQMLAAMPSPPHGTRQPNPHQHASTAASSFTLTFHA